MTELLSSKALCCSLCHTPIRKKSVSSKEEIFCCYGCETVYRILEAQGELTDPKQNPIFQEALKYGVISNPDLLAEVQGKAKETSKIYLELKGLFCPSCARLIELCLQQQKGIIKALVDYSTDLAIIEYDPIVIGKDNILTKIKRLGYQATFIDQQERVGKDRSLVARLGLAFFCAMNLMTLSSFIYSEKFLEASKSLFYAQISLLFALPVVTYCAYPFYKNFIRRIRYCLFGMETLVSIAVLSATFFSINSLISGSPEVYFDSASMLVSLVLLGKYLEMRVKRSTKFAFLSLHTTLPKKALKILSDGAEKITSVKDLVEGDLIFAKSGEKIVSEGIVEEGSAYVDESPLTGEMTPKLKVFKEKLIAGAFIKSGVLKYRLTRKPSKSSLQILIESIEKELKEQKPLRRFVDRVTQWFVPIIVSIAVTTGMTLYIQGVDNGDILGRVLSILLISCPCAIGIAEPLVESLARRFLAEKGLLVKNRKALHLYQKDSVWVFDKTGTLTQGELKLASGVENLNSEEKLSLHALAFCSSHPIAKALVKATSSASGVWNLDSFKEYLGKGVEGVFQGECYYLGSYAYMQSLGIDCDLNEKQEDMVAYFAKDNKLISTLIFEDSLKLEAPSVISSLPAKKTLLLSGDRSSYVASIAKTCSFKSFMAEKEPFEKRAEVALLKEKNTVIYVGDGINDAPSLALADIGIAVFSATETSSQVADIQMTSSSLESLLFFPKVALRTQKLIKQNIFWAFFYNSLGVTLAISGVLKPLHAVSLMILSSLLILANALRVTKKVENF